MEMTKTVPSVVALLLVVFVVESMAICNLDEAGAQACLPAVTGGASANPTSECCRAVANSDLHCFCGYQNSFLVSLMGIDVNSAFQIPSKCHIPFNGCN